jgi:hypothetical protein
MFLACIVFVTVAIHIASAVEIPSYHLQVTPYGVLLTCIGQVFYELPSRIIKLIFTNAAGDSLYVQIPVVVAPLVRSVFQMVRVTLPVQLPIRRVVGSSFFSF